jgi:hypothetical protein
MIMITTNPARDIRAAVICTGPPLPPRRNECDSTPLAEEDLQL